MAETETDPTERGGGMIAPPVPVLRLIAFGAEVPALSTMVALEEAETLICRKMFAPETILPKTVSDSHAVVHWKADEISIAPLAKETYVNGELVSDRKPLCDQDVIRVGGALFVFEWQPADLGFATRIDLTRTSTRMRLVDRAIDIAGQSSLSVLIVGPPGSGKAWTAAAIHERSGRLRLIPCPCIAMGQSDGPAFNQAEDGSLVFTALDTLPLGAQAGLRQSIDEWRSQHGADSIRFIATTRKDLKVEAAGGRFLEGLAVRFREIEIVLPALNQRRVDVLPLYRAFWSQLKKSPMPAVTAAAAEKLVLADCPSNIWDIEERVQRLALQLELVAKAGRKIAEPLNAETIDAAFVEGERAIEFASCVGTQPPSPSKLTPKIVEDAVKKFGSVTAAAKFFGVDERSLRRRRERAPESGD